MQLAHGVYNLKLKANMLILDATGPFNLQYVNELKRDINNKINKIDGKWGQITIFHNDSIFVPDAMESLKHSMLLRKESGIKCVAIVLIEPQCCFVIKNQIMELYESSSISYQFFCEYDLAEQWVLDQLREKRLLWANRSSLEYLLRKHWLLSQP